LTTGSKFGLIAAMNRIFAVITVLLALGSAQTAFAGFEEGLAAARRGDYATALREWKRMAEKGHAGALFNLGLMYADGRGVARNDEWAASLFRQAAELDHAYAQMNLAVALRMGKGVKQDHAESVKWFRKVAEKGHMGAQFNLAIAYVKGLGVKRDPAQAVSWFSKAAERGLSIAQYNLGRAYETGDGIVKDEVLALKWYALAALSFPSGDGRKAATAARNKMYGDMKKPQAQEAESQVRAWLRKRGAKTGQK
jgi:TPR repeat protein